MEFIKRTASTTPPNYSLFTIPAYLILAMIPHGYSVTLLSKDKAAIPPKAKGESKAAAAPFKTSSSSFYNMTSPRSPSSSAHYAAHLPPDVYARYERCRAAHANMFENSAFVFSAVLAGIFTNLDAGRMNTWCACYLLSRVLYMISYIVIDSLRWSPLRTVWYNVGPALVMILFWIYWEAGWKVARGQY